MKFVKFLFVQIFLCGFLFAATASSQAVDEEFDEDLPEVNIIHTEDFRNDSRIAIEKQAPILILFSMEGCGFCEYVEEEHLKPMLRNEDYRSKVIIRKVMTDDYGDVIDFDGKEISSLDFSSRYGAYMTPTVVFLDHEGTQLSRIMGVRNTEFYGGDLDNSLKLSLQMVRRQLLSMK